jgi:hypothetical protein
MKANVTITSGVDCILARPNLDNIFVFVKLKDQSVFCLTASKENLLDIADGMKAALEQLETEASSTQ